jgi:hypothetical protein
MRSSQCPCQAQLQKTVGDKRTKHVRSRPYLDLFDVQHALLNCCGIGFSCLVLALFQLRQNKGHACSSPDRSRQENKQTANCLKKSIKRFFYIVCAFFYSGAPAYEAQRPNESMQAPHQAAANSSESPNGSQYRHKAPLQQKTESPHHTQAT